MTTYQEPEQILREAVDSILCQTLTELELVIVLDNPDAAETLKILQEYAAADSRVIVLQNTENMGQTMSLNRAFAVSNGEYIARMDADDIACADRLEKQKKYLEDNDYDLIGGLLEVVNETGRLLYQIKRQPSDPEVIRDCLRYGVCLPHPSWFARRDVFTAVGGYREFSCAGDYDFLIRAALQGFRMSNLNEPVLRYRRRETNVSNSNLYRQYLTMKYLSKEYSAGRTADLDVLEDYVNAHLADERRKNNYSRGDKLFYQALEALQKRQWGKTLVCCLRLPFVSATYINKVYRFLMLDRLSRRGS